MGLVCMWSDMMRGNISRHGKKECYVAWHDKFSDIACIKNVVRTQGLIEKHNESLKDYVGEKNQRLDVVIQQMYSYKISAQRMNE